jgi:hypothetical protein
MSFLKRVIVALIAVAALVYAADYVVLRLKDAFPKLGPAFGTVQMNQLYAIQLKNGKTSYELDAQNPVITVSCAHSWFPHMGNKPCWYLQRQSQKPIPMTIMFPARP